MLLSVSTLLALLTLAYALFGASLGMVIRRSRTMPWQECLYRKLELRRQLRPPAGRWGAALGVTIAGTVVSTSYSTGAEFARATHPILVDDERLRRYRSTVRLDLQHARGRIPAEVQVADLLDGTNR